MNQKSTKVNKIIVIRKLNNN